MNKGIITKLSSSRGLHSSEPNKDVARQCVNNRELLNEIAEYLTDKNPQLAADCAEVMTEVAMTDPELTAKYAARLIPLLSHKYTRARWEAMHAIALVAEKVPDLIFSILPELDVTMHRDKSVIVRDYATESIARYAGTGKEAASKAYPILTEILKVWGDKHASRVIEGFIRIYNLHPAFKNEFQKIADEYKESRRGVVKKAAMKLEKILNKDSIMNER
ncbi:MAG: hypothetical protein HYY40_07520 [Bacteroidetes bacterium]|nr:hypothetical protein [Bacteroidota bacterium]